MGGSRHSLVSESRPVDSLSSRHAGVHRRHRDRAGPVAGEESGPDCRGGGVSRPVDPGRPRNGLDRAHARAAGRESEHGDTTGRDHPHRRARPRTAADAAAGDESGGISGFETNTAQRDHPRRSRTVDARGRRRDDALTFLESSAHTVRGNLRGHQSEPDATLQGLITTDLILNVKLVDAQGAVRDAFTVTSRGGGFTADESGLQARQRLRDALQKRMKEQQ